MLGEAEKIDGQRKMKQREADTGDYVGAHKEVENCLPVSFAGPGSGPLRTGCLPSLGFSVFL